MRLYTFTNFYLSDIQKGIQTAHIVGEMGCFGNNIWLPRTYFDNWAKNHKTIIVLNGGNQKSLKQIKDTLNTMTDTHNNFDFGSDNFITMELMNSSITTFCEDDDSLGGAMTAVGILVPEIVYNQAADLKNDYYALREFLKSFDLA
jgi:hypothetical protein